jgi:hypothetical protein
VTPRQPTGDRRQDVHNPVFMEAEARVLGYLLARSREKGGTVEDCRRAHGHWDFRYQGKHDVAPLTLDVKCEQWAARTGNVAWEARQFVGTGAKVREVPGWGAWHDLDVVVYVLPGPPEAKWQALFVDAGLLGDIAREQAALPAGKRAPGFKEFANTSSDRTTYGYAVPIALLRQRGAVRREEWV